MTDDDIKRLRDEAIKDAISEALDGGHEDLANLLTALWCDVDRLTRERDEARAEMGECEECMRALACYLGTGGYNADAFDPEVFHQKIRDGIDMATAPIREFLERASRAEARAERAEKVATAAQVWAGDKVVGDPNADRRLAEALTTYEATNAPAEPADTPQADIMGDEDAEGGRGETKTFARGKPLMGDGR